MSPRCKFPGKDLDNPPGQIINPIESCMESYTEQTLADYIERKEKVWEVVEAPTKENIEDAYLRGYNDGIAEGFQRGVVWMKGK